MSTMQVEVITPGVLEVLSVGKGDIKVTFDPDNPEEVEKTRVMINEMVRKGYSIFVEKPDGTHSRVKRFNKKHMAYVITEVVEDPKPGQKRTKEVEVPVAGSKAKAVGRTAGG